MRIIKKINDNTVAEVENYTLTGKIVTDLRPSGSKYYGKGKTLLFFNQNDELVINGNVADEFGIKIVIK